MTRSYNITLLDRSRDTGVLPGAPGTDPDERSLEKDTFPRIILLVCEDR